MTLLLFFLQLWSTSPVTPDTNPAHALTLTQDLTLGNDQVNSPYFFSYGTRVAVDARGIMAVLESRDRRVIVLSPEGDVITTFGSKGQGPGEFLEPIAITVTPSYDLAVFDTEHKKVMVFSPLGEFLSETAFPQNIQYIMNPHYLPDGNLVFTSVQSDAEYRFTYDLSVYNDQLKPIKQLQATTVAGDKPENFGSPGYWNKFLQGHLEANANALPLGAPLGNGLFVCHSGEAGGKLLVDDHQKKAITLGQKPGVLPEAQKRAKSRRFFELLASNPHLAQVLTDTVFESALRQAEIPRPTAIEAVIPMGGKGFGILAFYDWTVMKGTFLRFDAAGNLLARGPFQGPADHLFGTDTHLYALGEDHDEIVRLHRYKLNLAK